MSDNPYDYGWLQKLDLYAHKPFKFTWPVLPNIKPKKKPRLYISLQKAYGPKMLNRIDLLSIIEANSMKSKP